MATTIRRARPVRPLTPEERRGLEDVDQLLKQLIKVNQRFHARVDRLAHSVTTLGEPEVDKLLKALRKRIATAPPKKVAPRKAAVPRRRVRAA